MLKKDNLGFGLLIGFIIPLIGSVVYYYAQFSRVATVNEFGYYLLREKSLLTAMLSILLVVNIAIFTYYINARIDKTAKGIFIATLFYGLVSVIWKFFL